MNEKNCVTSTAGNAIYNEDENDDAGYKSSMLAKRNWRQWVRLDKEIYKCKDYMNPYTCSCQFLLCNPWVGACGPCFVNNPHKWKNAITGRDCVCSYSNFYGKK